MVTAGLMAGRFFATERHRSQEGAEDRKAWLNGPPRAKKGYLLSARKETRSATSCPGTVGKAVLAALSGCLGNTTSCSLR